MATYNLTGIAIATQNGGAATSVAISNSIASINGIGIVSNTMAAALAVSIDNTAASSNAGDGIDAYGPCNVILGRSAITANGGDGVYNSTISNTFYSYQDNRINQNGIADIVGGLNSHGSQ